MQKGHASVQRMHILSMQDGEKYNNLIICSLSLHDDTPSVRRSHHALFTSDLDLVLSLFLLDFLGEPFFHESASSARRNGAKAVDSLHDCIIE